MREEKTVYCNGCGKVIQIKQGIFREGVFQGEQEWGYFSEKDGERHSFCLCEACYDKLIKDFVIPVQVVPYL